MYWNPGNSISTVKSGNTSVKFCLGGPSLNLTYPKPPVYRLLLDREPRVPEVCGGWARSRDFRRPVNRSLVSWIWCLLTHAKQSLLVRRTSREPERRDTWGTRPCPSFL